MKRTALSVFVVCLALVPSCLRAQVLRDMFVDETRLDSLPDNSLRVELDAVGFFRDNEYDTEMQNGYSLPGGRIMPRLAYNPNRHINIEAGVSMLFFDGASKYPCYAYHDISVWKGNQYHPGCHFLPWLRLQAQMKHVDVILGNIYGGGNHQLITPLYNPEQNLSADPEMGVQVLFHRPHILLDVWLNWQSYIFETETHQEAFTVGTSAKILWGKRGADQRPLTFYTPVQLLIQHRGGEQDGTNYGVQTLSNAAIGVGAEWNANAKALKSLDAQLNAVASYQQAGDLWPFTTGAALHAGITSHWWNHLTVGFDYLHAPRQFVSLYGNPFYSTISLKHGGTRVNDKGELESYFAHRYDGLHNIRLGIDYQHTFGKAYTLGAEAELFSLHSKRRIGETGALHEFCFSFGVYLRVRPSFLLKKFK